MFYPYSASWPTIPIEWFRIPSSPFYSFNWCKSNYGSPCLPHHMSSPVTWIDFHFNSIIKYFSSVSVSSISLFRTMPLMYFMYLIHKAKQVNKSICFFFFALYFFVCLPNSPIVNMHILQPYMKLSWTSPWHHMAYTHTWYYSSTNYFTCIILLCQQPHIFSQPYHSSKHDIHLRPSVEE